MHLAQILPQAHLIEYSQAANSGIRMYTFYARYWRPIHSEVMTHRKFGRNARSSRAVPNKVLLAEPIMEPLVYGSNRPGMSAGAELTGWRYYAARAVWLGMAQMTRGGVRLLNKIGLHKQWSNRPLEWFGCIDMLITTTDLNNWFELRDSPFAMPEIQELARAMKAEVELSVPRILKPGEWHLPYITARERLELPLADQQKLSVARCARLSYKPFDGKDTFEAEVERYTKLVVNRPVHASPAEHQGTPDEFNEAVHNREGHTSIKTWYHPELHGNLRGWIQYRKMLPNEWIPG